MENQSVVYTMLERLAPPGSGPTSERIWRFSERMATVYEEQMWQFDEDEEARQWRRLYSADHMPPPSDTRNMANVAAMMAFYSPTNFCKFQKLLVQQLLEWESRQARLNPYPFGAPSMTIIDVGAGVGIASLATIDVLATWTEVLAESGYKQLGISVKVISVEPDTNKQGPRQKMLSSLSRVLDRHSIAVERVTEVVAPYPEPECIRQMLDAASGGSLAMCCLSNFVSSPCASDNQVAESFLLQHGSPFTDFSFHKEELVEWSEGADLEENAVRYARATARLLADLPIRSRLLLASELKERGAAARAFAGLLYPGLELSLQWNRVRFYSPRGSYWHFLRSGDQPGESDWATGFWSLAYWGAGSTSLASGTPDALVSARIYRAGEGLTHQRSNTTITAVS